MEDDFTVNNPKDWTLVVSCDQGRNSPRCQKAVEKKTNKNKFIINVYISD